MTVGFRLFLMDDINVCRKVIFKMKRLREMLLLAWFKWQLGEKKKIVSGCNLHDRICRPTPEHCRLFVLLEVKVKVHSAGDRMEKAIPLASVPWAAPGLEGLG